VVDVGCIDSIGHMETQPKLRLLEELVWWHLGQASMWQESCNPNAVQCFTELK
jgi:hypothetical protein